MYISAAGLLVDMMCTWTIQCTTPGTDYVNLKLFGQGNNSASTLTIQNIGLTMKYLGTV